MAAEERVVKYKVTADDSSATAAFARVTSGIKGAGDMAKTVAGPISALTAAVATVTGTIASLAAVATSTARSGEELKKYSEQLGATVENVARLKKAAELSETEMDSVARGINAMAKNMSKGSEDSGKFSAALRAIGLDTKKLSSDTMVAFEQIVGAMSQYENDLDRLGVQNAIFGKSGRELTGLINQWGKLKDQLSTTWTAEQAQRADEFADNLTRLEWKAKALSVAIGNELIPVLNDLLELYLGLEKVNPLDKINEKLAAQQSRLEGLKGPAWFLYKPGATLGDIFTGAGRQEEIERTQGAVDTYRSQYLELWRQQNKEEAEKSSTVKKSIGGGWGAGEDTSGIKKANQLLDQLREKLADLEPDSFKREMAKINLEFEKFAKVLGADNAMLQQWKKSAVEQAEMNEWKEQVKEEVAQLEAEQAALDKSAEAANKWRDAKIDMMPEGLDKEIEKLKVQLEGLQRIANEMFGPDSEERRAAERVIKSWFSGAVDDKAIEDAQRLGDAMASAAVTTHEFALMQIELDRAAGPEGALASIQQQIAELERFIAVGDNALDTLEMSDDAYEALSNRVLQARVALRGFNDELEDGTRALGRQNLSDLGNIFSMVGQGGVGNFMNALGSFAFMPQGATGIQQLGSAMNVGQAAGSMFGLDQSTSTLMSVGMGFATGGFEAASAGILTTLGSLAPTSQLMANVLSFIAPVMPYLLPLAMLAPLVIAAFDDQEDKRKKFAIGYKTEPQDLKYGGAYVAPSGWWLAQGGEGEDMGPVWEQFEAFQKMLGEFSEQTGIQFANIDEAFKYGSAVVGEAGGTIEDALRTYAIFATGVDWGALQESGETITQTVTRILTDIATAGDTVQAISDKFAALQNYDDLAAMIPDLPGILANLDALRAAIETTTDPNVAVQSAGEIKAAIEDMVEDFKTAFGEFQRAGEDIVETGLRIMNTLQAITDFGKDTAAIVAAIGGDDIAMFQRQVEQTGVSLARMKDAMSRATDPTDMYNFATQIQSTIYETFLSIRDTIVGLQQGIKQLEEEATHFWLSMQTKIANLGGPSPVAGIKTAGAFWMQQYQSATTPGGQLQAINMLSGLVDQLYAWETQNQDNSMTSAVSNDLAAFTENMVDALREQLQVIEQWQKLHESLTDTILSLKTSTANPANILERMRVQELAVVALRAKYQVATGEERVEAAAGLSEALQEYLSLSQEAYQRPSPEYRQIYDSVIGELELINEDARSFAEQQAAVQEQIRTLTEQIERNTSSMAGSMATTSGNTSALSGDFRSYYEWLQTAGMQAYAAAITDMKDKLSKLLGGESAETYLADLQFAAVSELAKINHQLQVMTMTAVPSYTPSNTGDALTVQNGIVSFSGYSLPVDQAIDVLKNAGAEFMQAGGRTWVFYNGTWYPIEMRHSGGPIHETKPYLLESGEYVLDKHSASAMREGLVGSSVVINAPITITAAGDATAHEIGAATKAAIESIVVDSLYYGRGKSAISEVVRYG